MRHDDDDASDDDDDDDDSLSQGCGRGLASGAHVVERTQMIIMHISLIDYRFYTLRHNRTRGIAHDNRSDGRDFLSTAQSTC